MLKILLQQVEDELSYNTTIKGQNDDEPVSFILTDRNETQLVFENRKHNYSQKNQLHADFKRQSGD
jgi:hypothetical protein